LHSHFRHFPKRFVGDGVNDLGRGLNLPCTHDEKVRSSTFLAHHKENKNVTSRHMV
jgi:hypothetical protein